MVFRGIKNRVFLQLWILFFISMLVLDFLVLFIFMERSISQYTEQKRFLLATICEKGQSLNGARAGSGLITETSYFPEGDRFVFFEINRPMSATTSVERQWGDLEAAVDQTLKSGTPVTRRVGGTVGLFLIQHQRVIITHPVKAEAKTIAAGGLESSLNEIYGDFQRIQKMVFIFLVINSFFFALLGNNQLTRIYFRPLKRLAKRAETYQEEDNLIFSVRKEDNEFSVLSSSLNKMLHRIAEDKHVLKETIGSLQKANTELKKAQNDVIRAEKLATVGRLTSGIAHEIGNPIGIVLGYLDLLKQADLTAEERSDFIDRSEKEITRISNIIRQLLDMSRSSAGEAKPVSINKLIEDLISVFNYQPTATHILFDSSLMATDDCVFVDPDQIRQVFLNILLNAVDAVNSDPSSNPWIKLTTESEDISTPDGGSGGRFIKVTIQDSGPGIDPLHLPHIFDPFYTTKQPGKGTGLGLSVSFMIVDRLGGQLSVARSERSGAVFQVILPLSTTGGNTGTGA